MIFLFCKVLYSVWALSTSSYVVCASGVPLPTSKPSRSSALPHASPPRPAFSPRAVYTGFWCLLILGAVTLWAPSLVLYDPMEIHSRDQFLAPGYRYALGTDFLGRDVLSRTVKGFRSSIPRVVVLTVIIGGVSWLVLNGKWRIQGLLSLWWRAGLALLHGIPSFVLAFMVFVVFEHHSWALDIALTIACLPVAAQLMTATNHASPARRPLCAAWWTGAAPRGDLLFSESPHRVLHAHLGR